MRHQFAEKYQNWERVSDVSFVLVLRLWVPVRQKTRLIVEMILYWNIPTEEDTLNAPNLATCSADAVENARGAADSRRLNAIRLMVVTFVVDIIVTPLETIEIRLLTMLAKLCRLIFSLDVVESTRTQ
jgi:hypothetical protein